MQKERTKSKAPNVNEARQLGLQLLAHTVDFRGRNLKGDEHSVRDSLRTTKTELSNAIRTGLVPSKFSYNFASPESFIKELELAEKALKSSDKLIKNSCVGRAKLLHHSLWLALKHESESLLGNGIAR